MYLVAFIKLLDIVQGHESSLCSRFRYGVASSRDTGNLCCVHNSFKKMALACAAFAPNIDHAVGKLAGCGLAQNLHKFTIAARDEIGEGRPCRRGQFEEKLLDVLSADFSTPP